MYTFKKAVHVSINMIKLKSGQYTKGAPDMPNSNKLKTLIDREQYVVKANDLIRRTRYDLTAQQQKIVLYCISKIKPDDDIHTRYEININDLAQACGLKIDDGYYYTALRKDLTELTRREWCTMPDGGGMTVSWIGDAVMIPLNSTVYVTFNPNMQPYLFDLREKYTQYRLQNVLVFKGKYSIRLYELLRSYTTQQKSDNGTETEIILELQRIREILEVNGYNAYPEFNRRILAPAIKEINLRAEDIHVDYHKISGTGTRKTEKICFIITTASAKQQTTAYVERKKKLDHIGI